MKKKKKLTLLFAFILLPLMASAYDVEVDGIYYNIIKKARLAWVASGDVKYTGNVNIPENFIYEGQTYNVISISSRAFYECTNLTSVNIPNSVTSIENEAFTGCSNLTTVFIGNGIETIGNSFENCLELTNFCCLAKNVPTTSSNAFKGSYVEYATLYVPTTSMEKYQTTEPWSNFGILKDISILPINDTVFPDANFRNWILEQSYGEDYVLTDSEIANIVSMDVSNKNISNLKGIENFTALIFLNCSNNLLESIDVSKNVALMDLYCSENNIKSLDLSNNKDLMQLECYNDGLTALNVSGCTKLVTLYCYSNQLGSLDVSGCTALANLYCYQNAIKDTKMDSFIESLPSVSGGTLRIINDESEGNLMTKSQVAAAKAKGWSPLFYNNNSDTWEKYNGNEIYFRGDANGDGEIGMSDVMFIVNYLLDTPDPSFNTKNADANLDGEITMSDATLIVNNIVKGRRYIDETSLASIITNIQVEEVMSNAVGNFDGVLDNLKTTRLVGYFGTTDEIAFPRHNPLFHKPSGEYAMSRNIGDIQLTVNPIGTDFSDLSVSLVNSQGEESSIKLSNLEVSDKLLKTGFTRARSAIREINTTELSSTGLYKTTASLETKDIEDPSLHIAVDKSAVRNAVKDVWNDLKNAYNSRSQGAIPGGTLNKVVNAIYNVVNGVSTERLAVKTEYNEYIKDNSGLYNLTRKTIVSPYDLSGVAVKPLGFESLPEQYRDSLRAVKKAKGFIKKLNDKIADRVKETIDKRFGLDKIESQIGDLQVKLAKIEPIDPTLTTDIKTHLYIKTNQDLKFDQDMTVGYEILVPTSLYETPGWEEDIESQGARINKDKSKIMESDPTFTMVYIEQDVTFHVEKTIPIEIDQDVTANNVTLDVSNLVEPVNNAVDAIKSINALCESVNNIIDQIRKIENKMDKGTYLNRVYKLIDRASTYTSKGIYKMFQPVLLVNSDKGFGFAGIRGVPAEVSGTVEVIPTTYSNGLVAPVYKKYISVNGKNGKVLEESEVALDITSELQLGFNTVEYYAIDFYGNEWNEEYVVVKK